jgi:hypothetical protein
VGFVWNLNKIGQKEKLRIAYCIDEFSWVIELEPIPFVAYNDFIYNIKNLLIYPPVGSFGRKGEDWTYKESHGEIFSFQSMDVLLNLNSIYEKVEFPPKRLREDYN